MKTWPLLPSAFLLLAGPAGFAQSPYRYVDDSRGDAYFGHVTRCDTEEDSDVPRVLREGSKLAERAEVNLPLTPGDTIRTGRGARCEVELDSGGVVRLDQETELTLETILAPSISSSRKLTNLVLSEGRVYLRYRQHSRKEVFQVLTENAAVKLKNDTVATVGISPDGASEVEVERGRADVLYGREPEAATGQKVEPGQKLAVAGDHRIAFGAAGRSPAAGFGEWNRRLDQRFEVIGRGRGFIPEPIFRYSPAVVRFAESYSRAYGQWVWSPVYGHAWRPHDNDYYPAGDWQPYRFGRWRDVRGELFWVPEEGWGWVPYHLGFWVWDGELGWIWIPGRYFAPAWVSWYGYGGYAGWRPWGFWDWYLLSGNSCRYGLMHYWGSCNCPSTVVASRGRAVPRGGGGQPPERPGGEGEGGDDPEPRPPPLEHKRTFERLVAALKRGDENARASLEATPRHLMVLREPELRGARVQERVLALSELADGFALPFREQTDFPGQRGNFLAARRQPVGGEESSLTPGASTSVDAGEHMSSPLPLERQLSPRVLESAPRAVVPHSEGATPRFRDWNPDVRAAQRLGASLTYSSEANEVRCPELVMAVRDARGGSDWSSSSTPSSGSDSGGGSSDGSRGGGASSSAHEGGGSRGDRIK